MGGGGCLQIKIFYFLSTKKHRENGKSTGKTQGKHREFGICWSVATLIDNLILHTGVVQSYTNSHQQRRCSGICSQDCLRSMYMFSD